MSRSIFVCQWANSPNHHKLKKTFHFLEKQFLGLILLGSFGHSNQLFSMKKP